MTKKIESMERFKRLNGYTEGYRNPERIALYRHHGLKDRYQPLASFIQKAAATPQNALKNNTNRGVIVPSSNPIMPF
ncbi:MAG: hypothetical protein GTO24_03135, partial [candidate division Zixibacteria bacterium]|nr:hypothetical protein [candidate division Zixibacteria bacterium]